MIPTPRSKKGSALVLVTLLTLIMAALAIVALRNVARSTQQAAVYTTRQQAHMVSSAGTTVVARRVGDKANNVYNRMQANLYGAGTSTDSGGTAFNDTGLLSGQATGATAVGNRLDTIRSGAYATFSGKEFSGLQKNNAGTLRLMGPGGTASPSFEDQRQTDFRVIVRDPIEAQPAEGFSEDWCFKKVTIATEASVGDVDDDWQSANNFARSRNALDGMIGPIKCGY